MNTTLKYHRLTAEKLAELMRSFGAINVPDWPTSRAAYVHLTEFDWDPASVGTSQPVYIVRFVGGQAKLIRHATPAELAQVRAYRARQVRGHIRGERGMSG